MGKTVVERPPAGSPFEASVRNAIAGRAAPSASRARPSTLALWFGLIPVALWVAYWIVRYLVMREVSYQPANMHIWQPIEVTSSAVALIGRLVFGSLAVRFGLQGRAQFPSKGSADRRLATIGLVLGAVALLLAAGSVVSWVGQMMLSEIVL